MDDPWGSPWAAADADKDGKLASSPPKSDLAPPPRALLSVSSSPRIPAVPEHSPWGGDDSEPVDWGISADTAPVHSIWTGGWGTGSSSPNLSSTLRDDTLGRTSPIAWPGSLATPKPTNGSALRQPSPDPWAGAVASGPHSDDGIATPRVPVGGISPDDAPTSALRGDNLGIIEQPVWDTTDEVEASPKTAPAEPVAGTVDSAKINGEIEQITAQAATDDGPRLSIQPAAETRESPSSSALDETTDYEEEPQESPHTSADKQARTGRLGPRKMSGKVQELVVKFDGLAKAAGEEPPIVPRSRSKSPMSAGKGDSDEAVDFGDFEEPGETGPTPLAPVESGGQAGGAPDAVTAPALVDEASPGTCPLSAFGPLSFGVELNSVAKLFTNLGDDAGDTRPDYEVPDHILGDSFTAISERKTWYRISRLGSSRRHDAADDESYRRVTWPPSTVRHDTIKIVRRWMEEDSIAGRVQLGGGISKTQKNMFGWDSAADPVALDAVFGKRNSHVRKPSLQTRGTSGNPGIDEPTKQFAHSPLHRPSGSTESAVAPFSWASSSPASAGHTPRIAPGHEAAGTPTIRHMPEVSPPQAGPASGPPVAPPPVISTRSPATQTRPSQGRPGIEELDDDEWGEMVSSPVTSAAAPATLEPLVTSVSSGSEQQTSAAASTADSTGPVPSDPWGSVDLAMFNSVPAKPAPHAQTSPVTPRAVEQTTKGATPAPIVESAVADTLRHTTALLHLSPSPTKQPGGGTTPQPEHDEAAQHILSNLPDLSYMLR